MGGAYAVSSSTSAGLLLYFQYCIFIYLHCVSLCLYVFLLYNFVLYYYPKCRSWPKDFSVWQEDEISDGGYRLIKALNTLPTNPEVEDIYDIENGLQDAPKDGFGLLNAIGDFAQGLMRM
mmetsp:Transcript_34131/g.78790  ORF Transcript_34131/g.78790 Transcript_34131/m.78790 type:complete len:120 (-) Transcript_34131:452-811(-)